MHESLSSDSELLAEWLKHRRESAFRTLVSRYAGLVYMAAMRTCSDDSLSTEASQLTFITLSQKAASLTSRTSLAGWLHLTAVMQTKNLVRKTQRETRKRQLLQATMEIETSRPSSDPWEEMQPFLDSALAALSEKDREALLLRFYRSLSVREIADILGIATDAAQKRLTRATERLRHKLTRRGFQTGVSLSTVMLAGFATDTQAAVPAVSLLSTKALAAGAAHSGIISSTSTLLSTAAMKTTSIVAPLTILLVGTAWLISQHQSIAQLEQQNSLLQQHLAVDTSSTPAEHTSSKTLLDQKPIDWEKVVKQLKEHERVTYLRTTRRLDREFNAMSFEQLIGALGEIAKTGLSKTDHGILEQRLRDTIFKNYPKQGLAQFFPQYYDNGWGWDYAIAQGFTTWAKQDQKSAIAWFDEQLSAGSFLRRRPDGDVKFPYILINHAVYSLLAEAPDAAAHLLSAAPEDQRLNTLLFNADMSPQFTDKEQVSWAHLIRTHLSETERLKAFSWPVRSMNLSEAGAYFKQTDATSEELISSITSMRLQERRSWNYSEFVEFALGYHEISGNDQLLIPLLEHHDHHEVRENLELARSIAERLSDETLRDEYLNKLK